MGNEIQSQLNKVGCGKLFLMPSSFRAIFSKAIAPE